MPTVQQLRYLVALADHGHFRRAAEACHVTQPTLSTQLRGLETRLGVRLVERSRSRVLMTPLGKRVAERARRVLREIEDIRAMARAEQGPLTSVLRVGVVQSLGSYLLPLVVPDLHASFPKLGLYIREGMPDALVSGLEDGGLDLLFFPLPINRADFDTQVLFREPIMAVVPQDHRLAKEPVVRADMLAGETVLTLGPGHRLYELVREICDEVGAEVSHDYEGTSLDTLRQMVATGIGLSLMPALYVKSEVAHRDIVVARRFAGTPPSRTIGLAWRRTSGQADAFREMADTICATLRRVAPEVNVLGP